MGIKAVILLPGGESPFGSGVDPDVLFESAEKDINDAIDSVEASVGDKAASQVQF